MIFDIFTNINKKDTLLNLLLFTIYVHFYDYTDFLKIYQLNFLKKVLRIAGVKYNRNVVSSSHILDYQEDGGPVKRLELADIGVQSYPIDLNTFLMAK